jgi:hypothetical protein
MGYCARAGKNLDEKVMRRAVICGSVMASFCVEEFSIDRMRNLTFSDIEHRYREFKTCTVFEDIAL